MRRLEARDIKDMNLLKHYRMWRKRNRTTQKYHMYKVSFQCKQLINKMYRIMLGDEDISTNKRSNKLILGKTYTDKVLTRAIYQVNKDKNR